MPSRTATPMPARVPGRSARNLADLQAMASNGEHLRRDGLLARALAGKLNCAGSLTLDVSPATSTDYDDPLITENSVLLLMPTTANAAAELATLYIVPSAGTATVNHSSSASSDRTFGVVIIG